MPTRERRRTAPIERVIAQGKKTATSQKGRKERSCDFQPSDTDNQLGRNFDQGKSLANKERKRGTGTTTSKATVTRRVESRYTNTRLFSNLFGHEIGKGKCCNSEGREGWI